MKKGKIIPVAFNVECPTCREDIPVPGNGSLMWTIADLEARTTAQCGCGIVVVVPMPRGFSRTAGV